MFQIGDKVVPHAKTAPGYCDLAGSSEWKVARRQSQDYLYIVRIENGDTLVLSHTGIVEDGGDYYSVTDVTFFEKWVTRFKEDQMIYEWIEQHTHSNKKLTIQILKYEGKNRDICNHSFVYCVFCDGEDMKILKEFQDKLIKVREYIEDFGIQYRMNKLEDAVELVERIKEYYETKA